MDQENILFFKNYDKSSTITELYLHHNIFFEYEDSDNYYDIDVNKILLFVSADEYIIRYNDVNKKKIVPLQLKIKNFYFGELHMFTNNIRLILIHSDDKEFFRNYRQIWNKITELTAIDDPTDFVETNLDDDEDEFIMLEVEKNTSAVRDKYRNDLVFVFHSALNEFPQTSLVQYRY